MIKVARTVPDHVALAIKNAKPIYLGETSLEECILSGVQTGRAFTLYDQEGRIGAIIGHQLLWKGVSSVWALVTEDIDYHPLRYARMIKRVMDTEATQFKLHRMEMAVKMGHAKAHKLARTLGFKPEGIMEAYNEDKSHSVMYGRVI